MSDIVREIAFKERQEGRQEGRREGRNEGKAEDVDLICLNMGMSLQEACVALGITVEEYERAKNALLTTI